MRVLRTPDECFADLPDYPFAPHYVEVPSGDGARLRMHYVDEGPRGADPVLCLHGEPSWSFLYRKMIPGIAAAGHRVVAPDLVGFGRSDKPAERSDYTYQRHVDWLRAFVEALDLRAHHALLPGLGRTARPASRRRARRDRFARVVAANTFLPTGETPPSDGLHGLARLLAEGPDVPDRSASCRARRRAS